MVKPKPPAHSILHNIWPDLLCLAGIAAYWLIAVYPVVIGEGRQGVDINRDAATAINVSHGRWLSDPAYAGYKAWYPPLSPILVAGVSSIAEIAPLDVYRYSGFFVNWLIPAGLFLLVRCQWNRTAAVLATSAFLWAMPWWQKEVHLAQASIHAVIGGWIALWLYAMHHKHQSMAWASACGLFQGLAFWHHPFVPAVLGGTFAVQSIWEIYRLKAEPDFAARRSSIICRNGMILAITLLVAAPILYLMMHGPMLNREPREYLAIELRNIEFALMNGNPWLWGTGILGLAYCVRQACLGCRIVLIATALTALAQIPGYLRIWGPSWAAHVPMIVPHEFQLLFQICLAIVVGLGAVALINIIHLRIQRLQSIPASHIILSGLFFFITGLNGLLHTRENLRKYLHQSLIPSAFKESAVWIRANTDINDVFACDPRLAFFWLGPETGRKVWLTKAGHSNPRIDWKKRADVLNELAETASPERFWELMHQNGIDFCIPTPTWTPRVFKEEALQKATIPRYAKVNLPQATLPIIKISSSP